MLPDFLRFAHYSHYKKHSQIIINNSKHSLHKDDSLVQMFQTSIFPVSCDQILHDVKWVD